MSDQSLLPSDEEAPTQGFKRHSMLANLVQFQSIQFMFSFHSGQFHPLQLLLDALVRRSIEVGDSIPEKTLFIQRRCEDSHQDTLAPLALQIRVGSQQFERISKQFLLILVVLMPWTWRLVEVTILIVILPSASTPVARPHSRLYLLEQQHSRSPP